MLIFFKNTNPNILFLLIKLRIIKAQCSAVLPGGPLQVFVKAVREFGGDIQPDSYCYTWFGGKQLYYFIVDLIKGHAASMGIKLDRSVISGFLCCCPLILRKLGFGSRSAKFPSAFPQWFERR